MMDGTRRGHSTYLHLDHVSGGVSRLLGTTGRPTDRAGHAGLHDGILLVFPIVSMLKTSALVQLSCESRHRNEHQSLLRVALCFLGFYLSSVVSVGVLKHDTWKRDENVNVNEAARRGSACFDVARVHPSIALCKAPILHSIGYKYD